MPAPLTAAAVANYFIDKARQDRCTDLSPMKLQKLVYFAHGWHAAINRAPLIDEQVEAWPYGPVVASLFHDTKHYGNSPVSDYVDTFDFSAFDDSPSGPVELYFPKIDPNDSELRALLDVIWDRYGGLNALQLSTLTHKEGTPWHQVLVECNGSIPRSTDIPYKSIQDWFAARVRRKHKG